MASFPEALCQGRQLKYVFLDFYFFYVKMLIKDILVRLKEFKRKIFENFFALFYFHGRLGHKMISAGIAQLVERQPSKL